MLPQRAAPRNCATAAPSSFALALQLLAQLISMAEILDSDDDSVCDLTEPEVIDLSADDTDLAAQLNAQLDEYIVIDSDSDDDVQFVS